jgi:hypothetical protein
MCFVTKRHRDSHIAITTQSLCFIPADQTNLYLSRSARNRARNHSIIACPLCEAAPMAAYGNRFRNSIKFSQSYRTEAVKQLQNLLHGKSRPNPPDCPLDSLRQRPYYWVACTATLVAGRSTRHGTGATQLQHREGQDDFGIGGGRGCMLEHASRSDVERLRERDRT